MYIGYYNPYLFNHVEERRKTFWRHGNKFKIHGIVGLTQTAKVIVAEMTLIITSYEGNDKSYQWKSGVIVGHVLNYIKSLLKSSL